jgi:hypothetical protein
MRLAAPRGICDRLVERRRARRQHHRCAGCRELGPERHRELPSLASEAVQVDRCPPGGRRPPAPAVTAAEVPARARHPGQPRRRTSHVTARNKPSSKPPTYLQPDSCAARPASIRRSTRPEESDHGCRMGSQGRPCGGDPSVGAHGAAGPSIELQAVSTATIRAEVRIGRRSWQQQTAVRAGCWPRRMDGEHLAWCRCRVMAGLGRTCLGRRRGWGTCKEAVSRWTL